MAYKKQVALDNVISAQDEYIKLLGDELDEVVGLASHGWKSNRFEEGQALRTKIERLKTEAAKVA